MDVTVLFADAAVVCVNKPAGITVIPERAAASEGREACLVELLTVDLGVLWVVHRLDRDTSGTLLLARTPESHQGLNGQFATRSVRKTYHALVWGSPAWEETVADQRLRPNGDARHRTVLDARRGKPADTAFRVLERFRACALLEARPQTGRIHQIRAHAAALGHPVVSDPLYGDGEPLRLSSFKPGYVRRAGGERPLLSRCGLHALSLELRHPESGAELRVEAPYPRDIRAAIAQLRKYCRS